MKYYLVGATALLAISGAIGFAVSAKSEQKETETALMRECRALVTGYQIIHSEAPQYDACKKAVNQGIGGADAHFYFGRVLYKHGYIEEAIAEFRKARAGRSSKGSLALGYLIDRGALPLEDAGKDIMGFYREALEHDDPVAKLVIAIDLFYKLDSPGEKDRPRAQELFVEAAAQNHPAADFYLAELFRFPDDQGKSDRELAVLHYRKAAEGGVADAIEALRAMGEDTSVYQDVPIVYDSVVDGHLIIERP